MVGLLITGHGQFATGLKSSLELITGITEHIKYVDFPGDSTETLAAEQNKALDELKDCNGVLVLSDLVGGSPFKCAVECKYARPDQKIEVVAGTNLSMMIEGASSIDFFDDPADLANLLINSGKEYIVRFELEEHTDDNEDEDGI